MGDPLVTDFGHDHARFVPVPVAKIRDKTGHRSGAAAEKHLGTRERRAYSWGMKVSFTWVAARAMSPPAAAA
jgi:hypothetical protein